MAPITANRPVYRDGNHLNEILTHKNIDVIEETKVRKYDIMGKSYLEKCVISE